MDRCESFETEMMYINNFPPYKFFMQVLTGGILLNSDWQEVSSCLRDFSE